MDTSLNPHIDSLYHRFQITLDHLSSFINEIGHGEFKELTDEIKWLVDAPFMFVIVGEVKAGKSSFINALLNTTQDLCPVAVSPKTDKIQLIAYGDEESLQIINPHLVKRTFPEESLKKISIIDTPGTNTIIEHHQEITERFIPHSDLIALVFEAKNPYRQSAWQFFDHIRKEWRKNIIIILQQKDLISNEDLTTNIKGVKNIAQEKGLPKVDIFALSAVQEQQGIEHSGFQPLRKYISENILKSDTAAKKLYNYVETLKTITEKIQSSIEIRKKQYIADKEFRNQIKFILESQQQKTERQIAVLSSDISNTFLSIGHTRLGQLKQKLSFWSVLKSSFSQWMGSGSSLPKSLENESKEMELELQTKLRQKLEEGITDVADDIQLMGRLVQQKLAAKNDILLTSEDIFSDIAEKRVFVLKELQKEFKNFIESSENFYDKKLLENSQSLSPNLAKGGGIAVVGVILSAALNGIVFDITGGILTTIGVLFAGISLGWKRGKILKQFHEEVLKGGRKIEAEMNEKLFSYTTRIKNRIDLNFHAMDQYLSNENSMIENLENQMNRIINDLDFIHKELENTKGHSN
ncbi:MAG TPA: dynamin family protein [Saprospiraceae bacterium]|nr:dynamin family protein [Saprospiraceae bacterium]